MYMHAHKIRVNTEGDEWEHAVKVWEQKILEVTVWELRFWPFWSAAQFFFLPAKLQVSVCVYPCMYIYHCMHKYLYAKLCVCACMWSTCVCVNVHVTQTHVNIYVHTQTHTHTHTHIYIRAEVQLHVYVHIYILNMYIYIYIYMCTKKCSCTFVYICICDSVYIKIIASYPHQTIS